MDQRSVAALDWEQKYASGDTPWDSREVSQELKRMLDEYRIQPCRTLELGCGTGTNAIYLATRGFEVTAVELSCNALKEAQERAILARVDIRFLEGDLLAPPPLGDAFPFVFDRGLYHVLRNVDIVRFRSTLQQSTMPGSLYLALVANANDPDTESGGPPRVQVGQMYEELSPLFQLVQLREIKFDGVRVAGRSVHPWAWSALWRRKSD